MPIRSWRAIGALSVAASIMLAGCDEHSRPTVASAPPTPLSATASTPSAGPASPTAPAPATGSATSPAAPSTPGWTPRPADSSLLAQFPDTAKKIPAAIDTVRQYYDAFNHAIDTGDPGPVSALFTSKCTECNLDVATVGNMLKDGRTLRGGHNHLISIEQAVPTGTDIVTVFVTTSEDGGDLLDPAGKVIHHYQAAPPTQFIFQLDTSRQPPLIWQLELGQ